MASSESEGDPAPRENERAEELFVERPEATIYRVPPEIYECDKKAYQPKAVCIGPFFYHWRRNSALITMQSYKYKCRNKLISEYHLPKDEAWGKIKNLLGEVKKRYSVEFKSIDDDTFCRMLMLDGCFLLHLLQRYAAGADKAKVDRDDARIVYGRLWIWNLVRYDLLLLHNQIPFCVIQSLNELLPDDKKINLVDCAINFFSPLHPCRNPEKSRFYIPVEDVHHLLHLIYLSVLPCPERCRSFSKPKSPPQWIPSATELRLDGIKFKKRKKARGFLSFLDVKFSDGVMEIPKIKIHDYSTSLFRNLIAFEQCYPNTECHVTVYAVFMNLLINTEQDMRLLHLNGVLINSMTVEKDAAHFFSLLGNEVHYAPEKNYLRNLFSDVNDYHDTRWHEWRAELYRHYFRSPLTILLLIGGAIALFFTIFGNFFH